MLMRLKNVSRGLCTFAIIALFAAACGGDSKQVKDSTVATNTAIDTCGPITKMSTEPATRGDSLHSISREALAFIVANKWCATAGSPEYQDAQRFIINGTLYGPVAQSVSAPNLDTFTSHVAFDAQFVNVAIIDVVGSVGTLTGPYVRLHLKPGLNCVFLKHEHTGTARWNGKIAPPVGTDCVPTTAAVIIPTIPLHEGEVIPPVTRFIERNDKMPHIGVRCGSAWCVVGAAGPADVPPPAHNGAPGTPPPPQSTVEGWFDDQTLAIPSALSPHGVKPSIRASIVPAVDLGGKHLPDFMAGFVHVAKAFFPAPATGLPAKYIDFGFTPGWNSIELTLDGGIWKARITSATGVSVLRKATRVQNFFKVPGSARWAWQDNDEWIWVACDDGCCLIEPTTIG